MKHIIRFSAIISAILLIVVFCIKTDKPIQTISPLNPTEFNLPQTAKEVITKRTDNTATFELSPGHYAAVSGISQPKEISNSNFLHNLILSAWAASSGPNNTGTAADDDGSGGTIAWSAASAIPAVNKLAAADGNCDWASAGSDPGICLDANTKVKTTNGDIEIKNLKVGDVVYSFNFTNNEMEAKPIEAVYSRSISFYDNKYYHIFYGEQDVRATSNHLFYVNGLLVSAQDLKVGDELLNVNGEKVSITKIDIEENFADDVWDISVKDNHNFFASGVLVHNAGSIKDHRVRIIKGGVIGAAENDKASGDAWPAALAYSDYGAADNLWGETWTAEDINLSTFGVAISAYGSGYSEVNYTSHYIKATNFGFSIPAGSTIDGILVSAKKYYTVAGGIHVQYKAEIDHVRITVSYTESTVSPSTWSVPGGYGSYTVENFPYNPITGTENPANSASPTITQTTPTTESTEIKALEAKITLITNLINLFKQQIKNKAETTANTSLTTNYQFTKDMKYGDIGYSVKNLQLVLNASGFYPLNNISGKFLDSTYQAVYDFQSKYKSEILTPNGLKSPTGIVGTATRNKINSLLKGELKSVVDKFFK